MPSFACVEAVALFARAWIEIKLKQAAGGDCLRRSLVAGAVWIEILLTFKEAVYYLRRPLCEGVD